MTFFTQASHGASIDRNLEMSDAERRNTIIARIKDSNAWEMHNNKMHPNKDAEISTISDDNGFSRMEKSVGKKHEEGPILTYNSSNGTITAECCCKKEKFVFNMKDDTVESEHSIVKMKELTPYMKKNDDNNPENSYGRAQNKDDNPMYNSGVVRSSDLGYNSHSPGLKYKN